MKYRIKIRIETDSEVREKFAFELRDGRELALSGRTLRSRSIAADSVFCRLRISRDGSDTGLWILPGSPGEDLRRGDDHRSRFKVTQGEQFQTSSGIRVEFLEVPEIRPKPPERSTQWIEVEGEESGRRRAAVREERTSELSEPPRYEESVSRRPDRVHFSEQAVELVEREAPVSNEDSQDSAVSSELSGDLDGQVSDLSGRPKSALHKKKTSRQGSSWGRIKWAMAVAVLAVAGFQARKWAGNLSAAPEVLSQMTSSFQRWSPFQKGPASEEGVGDAGIEKAIEQAIEAPRLVEQAPVPQPVAEQPGVQRPIEQPLALQPAAAVRTETAVEGAGGSEAGRAPAALPESEAQGEGSAITEVSEQPTEFEGASRANPPAGRVNQKSKRSPASTAQAKGSRKGAGRPANGRKPAGASAQSTQPKPSARTGARRAPAQAAPVQKRSAPAAKAPAKKAPAKKAPVMEELYF